MLFENQTKTAPSIEVISIQSIDAYHIRQPLSQSVSSPSAWSAIDCGWLVGKSLRESQRMISAFDYWDRIAKPTVEEFLANRKDVRRGMLAAMVVLHAVDYVFQNRGRETNAKINDKAVKDFKLRAAKTSFEFRVAQDFALAAKHCQLSQETKVGFHSGQYMVADSAFVGQMVPGRSFLGDEVGGVTIQIEDHRYANLVRSLKGAVAFLERELPELTRRDAQTDQDTNQQGT